MTVTKRVAPTDRKSIVVAGLIGTPVAEYNAHDAEGYVESIICGESGNLYEQSESNESATERKL